MSCSAHAEPSSRTKNPGDKYEAQAYVCTGWSPLPHGEPQPLGEPATWKPVVQQANGLWPEKFTTSFVKNIGRCVGSMYCRLASKFWICADHHRGSRSPKWTPRALCITIP